MSDIIVSRRDESVPTIDVSAWAHMNDERNPDPRGLGVVIFDEMQRHENNIAQVDAITGDKESHGQLRIRAIRVAQYMQSHGLTSDDIISICSANNIDCFVPYIAALFLGIKVAPLDPMLSIRECVHIIQLTEPKIIFCDEESVQLMEDSIRESGLSVSIVVFGDTLVHIPFVQYLKGTGIEENFVPKTVDIQDTAVILFTSGTTGLPKGICLTHFGLMHQTMTYTDPITILSLSRLYWISSTVILLISIYGGGCRVIFKNFEHKNIFKYVHDYKVDMLFLSPYFAYKITEYPEFNTYDTSNLKTLFMGGGLINESQVLKLRKFFPHSVINLVYGMTETSAAGTRFQPNVDKDLFEAKPTSVGRKSEGVQYKVLDLETNEEVGPHQYGELYIKTPAIMKGYYKNPEETAKVFDNDGYYKTGDIVYYDEDGCFFVVDRIKDLMKYQSWHITPGELEDILLQHPDVLAAVVISLPHEVDGDHPMGIVVIKEGSKCCEETLLKYVDGQVLDYKRLRGGIKFVKEIPITATGKFKRRELQSRFTQKKF